ncbi:MAG: hypothetical protein Q8M76_17845, partial [Spirochaetaceae bacterium]|nr:hypothetical protein [Spirochaetaceae bacterium]
MKKKSLTTSLIAATMMAMCLGACATREPVALQETPRPYEAPPGPSVAPPGLSVAPPESAQKKASGFDR